MTWDGGSPELPPLWGPGHGARPRPGPRRRPARAAPPEHRRHAPAPPRGGRARHAARTPRQTGLDSLCLAGGVALNCVVNGKIFDETPFTDLYIQPAAYDGGTSVGAAYLRVAPDARPPADFVMDHAYWGPSFDDARMRSALDAAGIADEALDRACAHRPRGRRARRGRRGRLVPGPAGVRASRARQPLDPDRPAPTDMKDVLNARIKHREPFRPFAPVVLEEATGSTSRRPIRRRSCC